MRFRDLDTCDCDELFQTGLAMGIYRHDSPVISGDLLAVVFSSTMYE